MLKNELKEIIQENQQLKDEKVRIMGVNSLLEQKIQVERSETTSLQNEKDHYVRFGGPTSTYGGSIAKIKIMKVSAFQQQRGSR